MILHLAALRPDHGKCDDSRQAELLQCTSSTSSPSEVGWINCCSGWLLWIWQGAAKHLWDDCCWERCSGEPCAPYPSCSLWHFGPCSCRIRDHQGTSHTCCNRGSGHSFELQTRAHSRGLVKGHDQHNFQREQCMHQDGGRFSIHPTWTAEELWCKRSGSHHQGLPGLGTCSPEALNYDSCCSLPSGAASIDWLVLQACFRRLALHLDWGMPSWAGFLSMWRTQCCGGQAPSFDREGHGSQMFFF